MEKEVIKSAEVMHTGDNQPVIAQYYLICSNRPFESGEISYISYGVGVQLIENENTAEDVCVKDVFFSKKEAVDFLEVLSEGKVTPCALEDVVSDYLKSVII